MTVSSGNRSLGDDNILSVSVGFLNYRNPRVFNEMIYNFLYLTNQ